MIAVTSEIVKSFAPTGALRAAINVGNPILVQGTFDRPTGITVEMATELATRLAVPLLMRSFDTAGNAFNAIKAGEVDIGFLANEPARAAEIEFTAPYVTIDGVYAVRSASNLRTIDEVDRPGIRISVNRNSAYDLFLTRTLKHAQIVRSEDDGIAEFTRNMLEVLAGVRQPLAAYVAVHPELRLLQPAFMEIRQSMCMPKGREVASHYLAAFVEGLKASGFCADALKRSGQVATVAPART